MSPSGSVPDPSEVKTAQIAQVPNEPLRALSSSDDEESKHSCSQDGAVKLTKKMSTLHIDDDRDRNSGEDIEVSSDSQSLVSDIEDGSSSFQAEGKLDEQKQAIVNQLMKKFCLALDIKLAAVRPSKPPAAPKPKPGVSQRPPSPSLRLSAAVPPPPAAPSARREQSRQPAPAVLPPAALQISLAAPTPPPLPTAPLAHPAQSRSAFLLPPSHSRLPPAGGVEFSLAGHARSQRAMARSETRPMPSPSADESVKMRRDALSFFRKKSPTKESTTQSSDIARHLSSSQQRRTGGMRETSRDGVPEGADLVEYPEADAQAIYNFGSSSLLEYCLESTVEDTDVQSFSQGQPVLDIEAEVDNSDGEEAKEETEGAPAPSVRKRGAPPVKAQETVSVAEEDDGDGRRKKPRKTAPNSKSGGRKFACPYFKRNPRKYGKWTSCPGPGWDEVHRVKTHLYRRHSLPIQCPRCWEVFKVDSELQSHLQQDPPCTIQGNRMLHEGFTKDQEKKLRSRKKTHADMTDEEKWREIYLILFPDDDPSSIPSPYYDDPSEEQKSGELEDFATFLRREMPTLVRRELEVLFQNEFQDIDERIRPRVAEIVLNLQPKLLSLYKQSQMPLSEWGPQPFEQTGSSKEPTSTPVVSQGIEFGTASMTSKLTPDTAVSTNTFELTSDMFQNGQFNPGWDIFDMNQGQWSADVGLGPNWDLEFQKMLDHIVFPPQWGNAPEQYQAVSYQTEQHQPLT